MALFGALAALGRLLERHPTPSDEERAAYDHEVRPVIERTELLYQEWIEHAAALDGADRLGNLAAIHRWQTATMRQALERVTPPAVVAHHHADLIGALAMAARAAQLLSGGSRFHNASAVCDGQTLLESSRERRRAAAAAIRRALDRRADRDRGDAPNEATELVAPGPAAPPES